MANALGFRRLRAGITILVCSVAFFAVGILAPGGGGVPIVGVAQAAVAPVDLTVVRTDVSPSGKRINGLLRNDTSGNVAIMSVKVEYLDGAGRVLSVADVPVEQRQAVVRPGETAPWWDTNRGIAAGGSLRVKALAMPTICEGSLIATGFLQSQTTQADGSVEYRFSAVSSGGAYAGQRVWRGYSLDASGRILSVIMLYRDEWEIIPKAPGTAFSLNYVVPASNPKPTSIVMVCELLREPDFTCAFDNAQPSADAQVILGGSVRDRAGRPIPGATVYYGSDAPPPSVATLTTTADGSFSISMPAPPTATYFAWIELDDVAGVLGTADRVLPLLRRPALLVHGLVPGWSAKDVVITFGDPFSGTSAGTTPTVTPDWTVSYRFLPSGEASSPLLYAGAPIVVSAEGSRTIEFWAQDRHAVGEHRFAQVRIDKSAPRTTSNAKKSYRSQATVLLRSSDTLSGVAAIRYRVNSGAWKSGRTIKVTKRGKHTLRFYAVDAAGNKEPTRSAVFTITP